MLQEGAFERKYSRTRTVLRGTGINDSRGGGTSRYFEKQKKEGGKKQKRQSNQHRSVAGKGKRKRNETRGMWRYGILELVRSKVFDVTDERKERTKIMDHVRLCVLLNA